QPTAGAEPNIAIAKDGTIFITAVAGSQEKPNALQGAAWLWRSKDHGATWDTLRSPQRDTPLGSLPMTRRPFGSSDADVVTSTDGWVYYSDWWIARGPIVAPVGLPISPGNYLVERSNDAGATWQSAPITTIDAATSVDRQWLVAGDNGTLGLFYAYFHPVQNVVRNAGDPFSRADGIMSIEAVWSHDHGASWSNPTVVVPPQSMADYQIAHPRFLGNHTFVMPLGWTDDSYGTDAWKDPAQVRLYVTRDDGASWLGSKVADVPQGFDNLWAVQGAADETGRVSVAWAARTNATMTVFLSESTDLGRSWTMPLALRNEGLNFLPWVAARGDGELAVAWYGGDSTGEPMKADAKAAWYPYVAHRPAAGQPFSLTTMSVSPIKTGPLCPKGAACGSDREILDYLSIAFDADGDLHAAFARSRDVNGAKAGLVMYAGAVAQP
ncbi:MAG: sialidase family protein, partial [Candidatus Thermoplasmatota archaeon]